MIAIARTDCPRILKGSPRKGDRYNRPEVVKELWEMQHGKCCYCEQFLPETGHAKAVEHFCAKSVFKWKRNEWTNLLLVCPQCNGKKSNKFPVELTTNRDEVKVVFLKKPKKGKALLIDPSDPDIDPKQHITFFVDDTNFKEWGQIHERSGSKHGRHTIDVVGLHHSWYLRRRRSHLLILDMCYRNLLRAKLNGNAAELEGAKMEFRQHMSADKEFAALAREFAGRKRVDRPENFGITIPIGSEC